MSSAPMQFAGIFSPPSISHHVFAATTPLIYSVTDQPTEQDHAPISLVPQLVERSTGVVFEAVSEVCS